MSEHSSNALNIVVGIIIGVTIITFVIGAVAIALKIGNNGVSETTNMATTMNEQKYTQYDGMTITGDQVVGVIKTFANDHICIVVNNGKGEQEDNWTSSDLTKAVDDNSGKLAEAQTKGKEKYIVPSTMYIGKIEKDSSTGEIIKIIFTAEGASSGGGDADI
jgi:hypothetical protein